MSNHITITGNLTKDPEIRFTASGQAVASFGIAVNRKWQNKTTKEWEEQTSFFEVTAWKQLAENVSESLTKGARVLVTGRLEQQSWEKDGESKTKVQIVADDVAPSLAWATCQVVRNERQSVKTQPQASQGYLLDEEPF